MEAERNRIPQVRDIRTAVRIYYERLDLTTKDICELFGCQATKANALKKQAIRAQKEADVMLRNAHMCDTEQAYITWGLDISVMEAKMKKLDKLNNRKEFVS